jgi:transposase-like protein
MATQRRYSIEFKRQVVQQAGETLHGLAKRHGISRNLIRIWAAKAEAGEFDDDLAAASILQEYEARIGALERLVGKLALENEFLNTPPSERRWLQITAQSRIGLPSADSGHIEVVVRVRRSLVFDVFGPDLIGHVAVARNPVASRPQVILAVPDRVAAALVAFHAPGSTPGTSQTHAV